MTDFNLNEWVLFAHRVFAERRRTAAARPRAELDPVIKAELRSRYLAILGPTSQLRTQDLEFQANVFVGTLNAFAESLAASPDWAPSLPQDQRRLKVAQFASALQRLQETLSQLDSAALSYVLHEADTAWNDGAPQFAKDPVEAFEFAGIVASLAAEPLSRAVLAVNAAASSLPPVDYDPLIECLLALERLILDHGLPFESKDTGIAAACVRAMTQAASISTSARPGGPQIRDVDRPKYLLTKVLQHPRSWSRFLAERKKLP